MFEIESAEAIFHLIPIAFTAQVVYDTYINKR
jgi:hypothetical protein